MINADSVKGRVNNFAKKNNIQPQTVLHMYFFERFLLRLEKSPYRDNFIIKGGLLVSQIIGIARRTTLDMDTTIKGLPLTEENILKIMKEIAFEDVGDGIDFVVDMVKPIREKDEYENFKVHLTAHLGPMHLRIKIDVTTGDAITPREVEAKYHCMLDDNSISLLSYPVETLIAEKYESIIAKNIRNTRMRDFYDLYWVVKLKGSKIDKDVLKEAIVNTCTRRDSLENLENRDILISQIMQDDKLASLWEDYKSKNRYVGDLKFNEVLKTLCEIKKNRHPINLGCFFVLIFGLMPE